MLTVAIIGLLADIAVPKFADLVTKSKEAAIKGKLGAMRSALSIYYADNEGYLPRGGSIGPALTGGGRYLSSIPYVQVPTSNHINAMTILCDPSDAPTPVVDLPASGGWIYQGSSKGVMGINCTHTDTKGVIWSTY